MNAIHGRPGLCSLSTPAGWVVIPMGPLGPSTAGLKDLSEIPALKWWKRGLSPGADFPAQASGPWLPEKSQQR